MIEGEQVRLRAIEKHDLMQIAEWRSDPNISKFLYDEVSISLAMETMWFDRLLVDPTRTVWMIEEKDTEAAIGIVGICKIDLRNRKAEYGPLLIGERGHTGKGYSREVEGLVLDYVFNYLNLHKLYGEVLCYTANVLELHRNSGFKVDGTLRDHVFKSGSYHDVVLISMLQEEYYANSNRDTSRVTGIACA